MPKFFPEYARTTEVGGREIKYWNTGRLYSKNGQRMVIARVTDDSILFVDIDRMIEGVVIDCSLEEQQIMDRYDMNAYHPVGNQDEYCVQRDLMNHLDELKALFTVVQ